MKLDIRHPLKIKCFYIFCFTSTHAIDFRRYPEHTKSNEEFINLSSEPMNLQLPCAVSSSRYSRHSLSFLSDSSVFFLPDVPFGLWTKCRLSRLSHGCQRRCLLAEISISPTLKASIARVKPGRNQLWVRNRIAPGILFIILRVNFFKLGIQSIYRLCRLSQLSSTRLQQFIAILSISFILSFLGEFYLSTK